MVAEASAVVDALFEANAAAETAYFLMNARRGVVKATHVVMMNASTRIRVCLLVIFLCAFMSSVFLCNILANMSVFASQTVSAERTFVKYFQMYFELVLSDLQHICNDDDEKWRNGLADIALWNDDIMNDEIDQFGKICIDAKALYDALDLGCEFKAFLKRMMLAASDSPAVRDKHYWKYAHRDRQAFLLDMIQVVSRAITVELRRAGRLAVAESKSRIANEPSAVGNVHANEPSSKVYSSAGQSVIPSPSPPTAEPYSAPIDPSQTVPQSATPCEMPLPDESVSQAAPAAVSRVSTFTFDQTKKGDTSQPSVVSNARFPSSVVSNQSAKIVRGVKEFSVVSRSNDKLPQSRVRSVPIMEHSDLETGVEYS